MDPLVSTEWLATELGAADLLILNASWHLPDEGRDAPAEHRAGHIPGAKFLDLGRSRDAFDWPGAGTGGRVVLYDDAPLHSAARGWWLLRGRGIGPVALLDGGLAKWKAEGWMVESGEPAGMATGTAPSPDGSGAVATKAYVLANIDSRAAQLVDARSSARFAGTAPEPRAGVEPGHMPGAINLPYGNLFHGDGTWKQGAALRAAFEGAGVDVERPVIASCGSGITAAVLLFGLHLLGREDGRLYDGSWAEWGSDPATPKVRGA